jgi:hypothetical protein
MIGSIKHRKSIWGFINKGLIDPIFIPLRHEMIAEEMIRRGYNHKSPITLEELEILDQSEYMKRRKTYEIPILDSVKELTTRCEECKKLYEENKNV